MARSQKFPMKDFNDLSPIPFPNPPWGRCGSGYPLVKVHALPARSSGRWRAASGVPKAVIQTCPKFSERSQDKEVYSGFSAWKS